MSLTRTSKIWFLLIYLLLAPIAVVDGNEKIGTMSLPRTSEVGFLLIHLLLAKIAVVQVLGQPTTMHTNSKVSGVQIMARAAATSIQVTWHMRDASIEVHEYRVSVQEDEFVHEIAWVKDTRTKFYDLQPCVEYKVSVQPFDKLGANLGPASLETVRTDAEEPPAVSRPSAVAHIPHSLTLSWKRPPTACEITAYHITYSGVALWGTRAEHSGSATIGRGDANDTTTFVIGDLLPYTDYTVTVAASTNAGKGMDEIIKGTTKQDAPSEPTNLNALDKSGTSITVVWKEPLQQKGVVDKYNVSWNIDDQHFLSEIANHPVHIIAQLTPCTTHTVQVAGMTEGGQGPHSQIAVTTESEAPSEPLDTTCQPNPENTITVKWAKPEASCPITGFKVSQPENSKGTNAMVVQPSVNSVTLQAVPGVNNLVCVAASTADTMIGPQACCEVMIPTPGLYVTPTTKGGSGVTVSQKVEDQTATTSTPMVVGIVAGAAVIAGLIVTAVVLFYKYYKKSPERQTGEHQPSEGSGIPLRGRSAAQTGASVAPRAQSPDSANPMLTD